MAGEKATGARDAGQRADLVAESPLARIARAQGHPVEPRNRAEAEAEVAAALVADAELKLRSLLESPFGREALIRMRRGRDPLVADPGGVLPRRPGQLALRLAGRSLTPKPSGRPAKDRSGLLRWVDAITRLELETGRRIPLEPTLRKIIEEVRAGPRRAERNS